MSDVVPCAGDPLVVMWEYYNDQRTGIIQSVQEVRFKYYFTILDDGKIKLDLGAGVRIGFTADLRWSHEHHAWAIAGDQV